MKNCLSWSVTIDAAKLDFVSDAYQVQIQAAIDITVILGTLILALLNLS